MTEIYFGKVVDVKDDETKNSFFRCGWNFSRF